MMVRTRPRGPLDARGIQQVVRRLKTRVGIAGRCSPHSPRHNFARSYLVDGGDVFSLQRILGHTTLDMVRRYVELAARHAAASPHHSGDTPVVAPPPPPRAMSAASGHQRT